MKSPHSITYDDLINQAKKRLEWMEASYPKMKITNQINQWTATHNIACQKMIVKLLEKSKRKPQMDLFEEFEKLK